MNNTNYKKLRKSLDNLKEYYALYISVNKSAASSTVKSVYRTASVKCFESVNDTLWKHFKKFVENQGNAMPDSPKPFYIRACEYKFVDEKMRDRLIDYNNARCATAHDYSMEKAEDAVAKIESMIRDAEEIYVIMCKEK